MRREETYEGEVTRYNINRRKEKRNIDINM